MHESDTLPIDPAAMQGAEQSPGIDYTKTLWRWKWLALFGAMLGCGLGYVAYRRQMPTYRSYALVQVVYPDKSAGGIEGLEPDGIRGSSRLDETRIITSTRVIDKAIDLSALVEHPQFQGSSHTEIRDWIKDEDRLVVKPSGRDSSTTLIDVSFICEDREVCKLVVDSVILGYETYLEEAYRSIGDEVVRSVTEAQQNLSKSYTLLSDKHATFRKSAPMVWLGDEAQNQFAENSVRIHKDINELNIEHEKLKAILGQVSEAQDAGRSSKGILMMLANDLGLDSSLGAQENQTPAELSPDLQMPVSSAEQRRALMELQMREQELLDTVGESHPSIASLRRRIALIASQVDHLSSSERKMAMEAKELMSSGMNANDQLEVWKSSIQERMAALTKQGTLLKTLASEAETKSKELQGFVTKNRLLNSELAAIQQLLDGFNETVNRIQILPRTTQRSMETLTPARLGSFHSPNLLPFISVGGGIGFVIIIGIGFLAEWLDQSFRGPDEVTRALGTGIIGHIPQMSLRNLQPSENGIDPSLCTIEGDIHAANEAFRAVRTNIYFSEMSESHRIIQVTSPCPGDGKSTLAANLAVSIAQSGRSVLLIDADMRRPRIAGLFGNTDAVGIGEVILGQATLASALRPTPVNNLTLLASNEPLTNPSEIVSHQRFQEVLTSARKAYDFVIIDTPPVLAVADALAVAARTDAVVMTFRLRRDSKPTATESINALRSVGARMLGVVINGVTGLEGYDLDRYGYGYGYAGEASSLHATIEDVVSEEKIDFQTAVPPPKGLFKSRDEARSKAS